ncbi:hypothetical protein FACS1894122_02020 [Alphaproteobacteria bacterium]|nr:hypothetical protein FACS1894122_02020 [Alphaproteobacteria bacterium]
MKFSSIKKVIFSQNCSKADSEAEIESSVTLDVEMDLLLSQAAEIYGIRDTRKICVAVSGGSDSMSLLVLAHAWARKRNFVVSCVTVDHKLRPESASEALFVRDFCQSIGLEHHILEWNHQRNQRDVGSYNASLPSETSSVTLDPFSVSSETYTSAIFNAEATSTRENASGATTSVTLDPFSVSSETYASAIFNAEAASTRENASGATTHGELENLAREARYSLIEDFCKKSDIKLLLTGHTLNDQLETFEMRKQSGSSEFGLAGMSRMRSVSDDLKLLRPILGFTKKQLENFLIDRNILWKNDPMNEDESFKRVFHRKQIMSYNDERFFDCVNEMLRLREMRNKIEKSAVSLLKNKDACIFSDFGYATLDQNALLAETTAVQREIIKRIVWNIGGKKYTTNITEEMLEKILAKKINTIGRCLIKIKKNTIYVFRENRNFEQIIWNPSLLDSCVFDNRFLISVTLNPSACSASMLGEPVYYVDAFSTSQAYFAYNEAAKKTPVVQPPNVTLGLPCICRNNTIVFVHGIFCDNQMKKIGISSRFIRKVNLFDVFL